MTIILQQTWRLGKQTEKENLSTRTCKSITQKKGRIFYDYHNTLAESFDVIA